MSLIDELDSSLKNMKYALNQNYNFQRPNLAFITAYLHFLAVVFTEFTNIAIILYSPDPINIVLNFIAIAIITEFDDYVYASVRNEPCKKLIEKECYEKVLVVHHTTSKSCGDQELSYVKDENGEFRKLKIKFSERPCGQKCGLIIYRMSRMFYVSIYFYFLPFFTIVFSVYIPLIFENAD